VVEAVLRHRRRRASGRTADAAVRYAALGWPVCLGAYPPSHADPTTGFLRSCSCDRLACPFPGSHPVSPAWQRVASADPELVAGWWATTPTANVILPTGRVFDVLDVPASVGVSALNTMERTGVRPGPVAVSSGGRAYFFVRSRGAPADEYEWWSCHLDCLPEEVADVAGLRWHCRDSYVLAPPSRTAAGPAARWLRDPASYELPDGVRLLEVLADACEQAAS
jgi:Bifunctional DNA primase/polymerase, N-terminal